MALVVAQVVLGEDRIHGALGLAQSAVDALLRVDHQEVRTFVEAVHRTHFDAVGVLALDTAFYDNEGHRTPE